METNRDNSYDAQIRPLNDEEAVEAFCAAHGLKVTWDLSFAVITNSDGILVWDDCEAESY
jgi:hypothetical protein